MATAACPDLSSYFAASDPNWLELEQQLAELMPECLDNSQYFALIGTAQLNSNQLSPALESLERALLIDPNNGAAQIDYAQALFELGQLFGALELNEQLLQRADLPVELQPLLEQRHKNWRQLTRQVSFEADVLTGFDDNLNEGPDSTEITLTPSGESILLTLSPELQPISGPYLSVGLTSRYRQLAPAHQHNWTSQARGRLSEDSNSDFVQLASQYAFVVPDITRSWQLNSGITHLLFGGNSLFSGIDAGARYQFNREGRCRPYYTVGIQQQWFHEQNLLNGLEGKAGAGFNCDLGATRGSQQFTTEISALSNKAQKNTRAGGSREGWQMHLDWRYQAVRGEFRAQLNFTSLNDTRPYSAFLENGAERWQHRSSVLLQYNEPLQLFGKDMDLLLNVYHQRQQSNIALFRTTDTTAEIGLHWRF